MAWTPYYKPKFYRHLNHLVINGFYARTLDADDHAFIESVKTKGIANGSLPSTNAVLIEELGFWEFPYAIQPGIERRVGKPPPIPETPEQRELRKARVARWHAQRAIRKQEREIAAAELKREEREQAEAMRRRKVRDAITDAEWDAAAPKEAPFGATIDGKHVPQWKLEELGIKVPPVTRPSRWKNPNPAMKLAPHQLDEAKKRLAAAERAMVRKRLIADEKSEERRRQIAARRQENKVANEQHRRERILAEARETVARVARMEREWDGLPNVSENLLKEAILTLLHRSPGQTWTGPDMARAIGCTDVQQMNRCLDELVKSGRLETRTPK